MGLRLQPAPAAGVKGQLLQSSTSRVSGAVQRWPWRVYTSVEVARLTHLVCRAQQTSRETEWSALWRGILESVLTVASRVLRGW